MHLFIGKRTILRFDQGQKTECIAWCGGHEATSNRHKCEAYLPHSAVRQSIIRSRSYYEMYRKGEKTNSGEDFERYIGSAIQKERIAKREPEKSKFNLSRPSNKRMNNSYENNMTSTSKDYANMSIDQLIQALTTNQSIIKSNEQTIKNLILDKLLEQQKTISSQEAEIARLRGEKQIHE